MPVFWLPEDETFFPHPSLSNEDGILAVGGDLSPQRLLLAYQLGIFPWYNPGDPIMWWSPDPRFVLFPDELKVSRSMRPYFNQHKFTVTFDLQFQKVMKGCQRQTRKGQSGGTWISSDLIKAYTELYQLGYAHSVEVWQGTELVGGLYGLALGKCFFGESMFAQVTNASKFGFITLVQLLKQKKFWLIDCQQQTSHLASLGARAIPRTDFLHILKKNEQEETSPLSWKNWPID